ncbi:hypothetical protein PRIC2_014885 [Phytophthora ramorum]
MKLESAISLWRGRPADAAVTGVTVTTGKENAKHVLVTSAEDVREFCSLTRKCLNHWSFRAGSAHALRVPAARHPNLRSIFGVCGAPGVSASKKARQAKRQEANKTAALPANEALTVWCDSELEVAKWRRAPLQSTSKAFSLLVHTGLKKDAVVVFEDGSFAAYNEDLTRIFHSDDAQDAVAENEEEEEDEEEETVVWASFDTDSSNLNRGSLFISILMQKTNMKLELMVYEVVKPSTRNPFGAVLRVRRRVDLPENEELGSCAFHASSFSYSFVGRSGSWKTLRFSRDALTKSVTLMSSQQMPSLASAHSDSTVPVHKKRKLKAASAASGFMACGLTTISSLVSVALDGAPKITAWDAKFAVPVSTIEINLSTEKEDSSEVVVGRGSNSGVGKLVQLASTLLGEEVIVAYERAIFFIQVMDRTSTLASVLGAAAHENAPTPAMPNSVVQWEGVTATSSANGDTLDAETWKSNVCSDDDRERQLIADLSDPKTTPTAAEFATRLNNALKKNKRKAGKVEGEDISYRLLQAVTRRCLESTDLKLWGPLEAMLRTNRLSARAEPTLLPTLMKHNQFALLQCAIVYLVDIDERSIVRLLKYFIRKSSNAAFVKFVTKQVKSQNKNAGAVDSSAACERFAVALLALPTNSVFLHHAIRELEVEEVLLLLAICKKLLLVFTTGDDDSDDEEAPTKKSKKSKKSKPDNSLAVKKNERRFTPLPSASNCCAWICALLDAHLPELVQRASQHAEVSRTLHQLEDLVQLLLHTSAQYETVHGVLRNFLSGVQLPRAPGIPDYSLEELRL